MEVQVANAPVPDGDRRRFRSELRALRLESGLSEAAVADRVAWPAPRVTQLENGEIPVSPDELDALLEAYGVSDPEHVETLRTFARAASDRIWWGDNKYLPDSYLELISAEADAARITHFHPTFIPGLLQTWAYATAITPATTLKEMPAGMTEALVEARIRRQRELFDGARSVEFSALVDENALYRRVGSGGTMREQLDHLAKFVEHDRVKLAIIPRAVDSHPGLLGGFMVLEYQDLPNEDVVCFEGHLGNVVIRARPDLAAAYCKLSERLSEIGLTGDSARASIREAQRQFS
jgi:transcriptional regulator with XRE-family HTH domain